MKDFDVIIVGGGIHGAGVLQAVAAAGHSALLIEKQALASGTSSRSSKLIHGGLRYLESGQFAPCICELHRTSSSSNRFSFRCTPIRGAVPGS